MDNKVQLILIIVVSILVATNIFTYTRATALEKDFNVKLEQIDTEFALQSRSIQFVQTDLGYLGKHLHTNIGKYYPEGARDVREINGLFCSNDGGFGGATAHSGAMAIIRNADNGDWHTIKCE